MAYADIVVNDGASTPVAHTFTVFNIEGKKVLRQDQTRTPDLPLQMTIGHTKTKVKGVQCDSHLVRFDEAVLDADGVTVRFANIRVMMDIDPAIFSDGLVDNLTAFVRNYLTGANGRLIARGSVG